MSTTPAPTSSADSALFTVERYLALVDEGLLGPDDRVELLEGVVVAMAPSASKHITVVHLVARALTAGVGKRAAVRSQGPLILAPRSMPDPDIAVVAGTLEDYMHAHPTTALLVVEVSDSSLRQDQLTKSRIYARAEIPEYWIVDLRDHRVEVHRSPVPRERRYANVTMLGPRDTLAPAAFPDVRIPVDALLPDRASEPA